MALVSECKTGSSRRKDNQFVTEGQVEDEYALGYVERGMGRMVAGERDGHRVLGTSGFISHSLNPAQTA